MSDFTEIHKWLPGENEKEEHGMHEITVDMIAIQKKNIHTLFFMGSFKKKKKLICFSLYIHTPIQFCS